MATPQTEHTRYRPGSQAVLGSSSHRLSGQHRQRQQKAARKAQTKPAEQHAAHNAHAAKQQQHDGGHMVAQPADLCTSGSIAVDGELAVTITTSSA
jgi:hypothetical protein